MDHTEVVWFVCAGATMVALTYLYWFHWQIERGLRRAWHRRARYPLFEARDDLVMLVVDGKMTADDPAWKRAYTGVNALLGLHERISLFKLIELRAMFLVRAERDPEERARRERFV